MLRIGTKRELLLRKPERGFSANFLKGLALALAFHLTLFFGLRISLPANPDAFPLILPVAVEIDLETPLVMPYSSPAVFSPIRPLEPPQLLEMPLTRLSLELPEFPKAVIHEPDFSVIEKIPYEFLEDLEDD